MIPKTPVVQEALALMKDWEKEPEHVLHVTDWAVQLFDELRPEHKLGKKDLDYLTAGSLLHDVGWATATEERPHHKESARRIREHPWQNLTQKEREFVALVARYHRKSAPSAQHNRFKNLETTRRDVLRWLAGILRIADAMDRSPQANTCVGQTRAAAGCLSDLCQRRGPGRGPTGPGSQI